MGGQGHGRTLRLEYDEGGHSRKHSPGQSILAEA